MLNLLIITNLQDNLDRESIEYLFFSKIQLELKKYFTKVTVFDYNNCNTCNICNTCKPLKLMIKQNNISHLLLYGDLPNNFLLQPNLPVFIYYFFFKYTYSLNLYDTLNLQLSDEIFVPSIYYQESLKLIFPFKKIYTINPLFNPINLSIAPQNKQYSILLDLNYSEIKIHNLNLDTFLSTIVNILNKDTILLINISTDRLNHSSLKNIVSSLNSNFIYIINEIEPLRNYSIDLYISINWHQVFNLDLIKYQYYGIPVIATDTELIKPWIINGKTLSSKIDKWNSHLEEWCPSYTYTDLLDNIDNIKNRKSVEKTQQQIIGQSYMMCNTNDNKFQNTFQIYFNLKPSSTSRIAIIQYINDIDISNKNKEYCKQWQYDYFRIEMLDIRDTKCINLYLHNLIKYLDNYDYLWVTIGNICFVNYLFSLHQICNDNIFGDMLFLVVKNSGIIDLNTIVVKKSSKTREYLLNLIDSISKIEDIFLNFAKIIPNKRLLYSRVTSCHDTFNYTFRDFAIMIEDTHSINQLLYNNIDKLISRSIYQNEYIIPLDIQNRNITIFNRYQLIFKDKLYNYKKSLTCISIEDDNQLTSITGIDIESMLSKLSRLNQDNRYGIYINTKSPNLDFLIDKIIYCLKHNYNLFINTPDPPKKGVLCLNQYDLIWNLTSILPNPIEKVKFTSLNCIDNDTFIVRDEDLKNNEIFNLWNKLS